MLRRHRLLAIATVCLASACFANHAQAQRAKLSSLHYQYFNAIHAGDIQKARDLVRLGNIDPNDIGGYPLVASLFSSGTKLPGSVAYLSDPAFDYVFKELKQSFNTPLRPDGARTVFSAMCSTFMRREVLPVLMDDIYGTIRRIKFAFDQGADPKPLPNIPDHMRKHQPLPVCIDAYLRYRNNYQFAGAIRSLLNDYIEKGADPNYEQPLALAAENLDAELFGLLATHNANFGRIYRVRGLPAACSRGTSLTSITTENTTDLDTLLGRLPSPKDANTALAHEFLVAYIEAGGDIDEPQHQFRSNGGTRCEHTMQTHFERAVHAGQVTYASMVQKLQQLPKVSKPQQVAASQPEPAASITPPKLPPGPRITTSNINVRQTPSITGTLTNTLGPHIAFHIEQVSADGHWSLINAAPVARGWANTIVLGKSSVPNTGRN